MITKNAMQLKAYIKKKAAEKIFRHSLLCRIICLRGCLNEYLYQSISRILF